MYPCGKLSSLGSGLVGYSSPCSYSYVFWTLSDVCFDSGWASAASWWCWWEGRVWVIEVFPPYFVALWRWRSVGTRSMLSICCRDSYDMHNARRDRLCRESESAVLLLLIISAQFCWVSRNSIKSNSSLSWLMFTSWKRTEENMRTAKKKSEREGFEFNECQSLNYEWLRLVSVPVCV